MLEYGHHEIDLNDQLVKPKALKNRNPDDEDGPLIEDEDEY